MAPTQRAARRNRRRMWCLGHVILIPRRRRRRRRRKLLVLDTVVMRRCRVRLCVPHGGARHRARRRTQVRRRRRLQRRPGSKEASALCKAVVVDELLEQVLEGLKVPECGTSSEHNRSLHAPRPAIIASPPGACALPTEAASHRCRPGCACAACMSPPPTRPAAWEASVGGVRGFR